MSNYSSADSRFLKKEEKGADSYGQDLQRAEVVLVWAWPRTAGVLHILVRQLCGRSLDLSAGLSCSWKLFF
jgi:hypothetical protein